jgi:probable phosphoglycerate mutase
MTTLFLARHGQTIWHAENRFAGSSDIALTETGAAQARGLAAWAGTQKIAAVIASPLLRARETAKPAAARLGLELATDARLRESDFGSAEGLTMAELRDRDRAVADAFVSDPAANPWPGGEAPEEVAARAIAALRDAAAAAKTTLIVAHSTMLRLTLCKLLGIPLSEYRRRLPELRNTAVTTIKFGPEGVGLINYNVPVSLLALESQA